MTYIQADLSSEAHTFIKLWRQTAPPTPTNETKPARKTSSHAEADFLLRLRLLICVHGDAGPVPSNAGFNINMKKATFLILETIIFTTNYSPCRYESLEVDLDFRNYENVKGSRAPQVVSLAPWREERRVSSPPSTTRPGQLRHKLTTDDFAQSENPDRLKFCWENTARNERSSFPTGSVMTTPQHDASDVHNTVHWSLQTDNDPLNEWQRTTKGTQTTGYTHTARTAFAMLLQREHDDTFFAEMELKVKGDVYKAVEKRWDVERSGETLPGNVTIVFQPDSEPVQDAYQRDGEAGKVNREELGYWTETKRGRLEVLKACPVFRPLRIPDQE